ncbi:MAG: MoaD/ThiS family protein [Clostridia bacterium]|nr:MoaD/ThiS family protein [Clostridia bacterium]
MVSIRSVLTKVEIYGGRRDGSFQPDITVLVNGRNIQFLQGMATPLNPDDEVTLIPPVAGG